MSIEPGAFASEAAAFGRKRRVRTWVLIALVPVVIVGVGCALWFSRTSAPEVATALDRAGPVFLAWRVAIFGLAIIFWPHCVRWMGRLRAWSPAQQTALVRHRWRVATWLIVLELVLVQVVASDFFNNIRPAVGAWQR